MDPKDLQRAAADLSRVLNQTDEHGMPVFAQADLDHFIPWVVFTLDVPFNGLKPRHQRLVINLVEKLDLPDNTTTDQLREAVKGYYNEHPVNPKILADWQRALRGVAVATSKTELTEDEKRQMGQAPVQGGVFENVVQGEAESL